MHYFVISFFISLQFFLPKINPGLGHPITHGTAMLMPKTSMDEDNLFPASEHKVRASLDIFSMKTISVSQRVYKLTNSYFRLCIRGPHQGHLFAACLWCQIVFHAIRLSFIPDEMFYPHFFGNNLNHTSIFRLLTFSRWKHNYGRKWNTGWDDICPLKNGE